MKHDAFRRSVLLPGLVLGSGALAFACRGTVAETEADGSSGGCKTNIGCGGSSSIAATTLVDLGKGGVVSIAVDTNNVYWSTEEALWSVPKGGGAASPISMNAGSYWSLHVDATNLYWSGGHIEKMPLGSKTPIMLAGIALAGEARMIAVDATSVFWPGPGDGSIMNVAIAGGTPSALVSGLNAAGVVAVDDTNVYWDDFEGSIHSMPIGGGPVSTIAEGHNPLSSMVVSGGYLFWTMSPKLGVARTPIGGGAVEITQDLGAEYLAIDSDHVYWTNHSGSIKKMSIGGGQVTTVISFEYPNADAPSAIAVDATRVYWGDWLESAIHSAPKAP
jgi:hypothetical protein